MRTVTKIILATTAAIGLLYAGDRYNVNEKMSALYQKQKEYVMGSLQYPSEQGNTFQSGITKVKETPKKSFSSERVAQKSREQSDLSLYVAAQPLETQMEIFREMYRGIPEKTQQALLVTGFNALSYDGKIETLDAMAKSLEKDIAEERNKIMK